MTGWLILWGIAIAYWVVGIKRMPVYFKRSEASFKKGYPMTCRDDPDAAHKHAAWAALGLAAFWPFHEGGRWIRDHIIHTMTAEERRVKEYKQAERIVAEYTQRKEREAREEFDRKMRGAE